MAESKRTFYRNVLIVEILSEDPFDWDDLRDVYDAITTGDCSGRVKQTITNQKLTGAQTAKRLLKQASDPSFFRLTETGADD
jgi:hypothetical protein